MAPGLKGRQAVATDLVGRAPRLHLRALDVDPLRAFGEHPKFFEQWGGCVVVVQGSDATGQPGALLSYAGSTLLDVNQSLGVQVGVFDGGQLCGDHVFARQGMFDEVPYGPVKDMGRDGERWTAVPILVGVRTAVKTTATAPAIGYAQGVAAVAAASKSGAQEGRFRFVVVAGRALLVECQTALNPVVGGLVHERGDGAFGEQHRSGARAFAAVVGRRLSNVGRLGEDGVDGRRVPHGCSPRRRDTGRGEGTRDTPQRRSRRSVAKDASNNGPGHGIDVERSFVGVAPTVAVERLPTGQQLAGFGPCARTALRSFRDLQALDLRGERADG